MLSTIDLDVSSSFVVNLSIYCFGHMMCFMIFGLILKSSGILHFDITIMNMCYNEFSSD